MQTLLRRTVYALILLCSACAAIAQVATGTYNYGTYDTPGIDTINVGNLNVNLAIPILNKAGRGIPFSYTLTYDSSVWYPSSANGATAWQPSPRLPGPRTRTQLLGISRTPQRPEPAQTNVHLTTRSTQILCTTTNLVPLIISTP
jgi:hypothetical protein